ncbi:MAG TPA: hypothetical protein VFT95_19530, partial [Micromonosporaceae bacterium]|nr:hypothetical protein [Micromonosporaceae bacterium]
MAGRLRATRGRVSGVASTVNGVNVGPQSMGIVGSGFTGAARSHVRHAQEQVARAGQAVEQAEAGTRGTAEAYRGNEATSAAALATIDTSSRPPTTSTPPAAPSTPAPPPPPGGGGPPRNNLGNTADSGELTPQFPRHALDTATTSTEQQIRDIAAAKGYDPDAHIPKTQTPTATLSHDDRVEVADVRNGFQVAPGEVMTKVVKPELADAMLRNQTTFTDPDTGSTRDLRADELGGSVARGSDTAQYDRPVQFREKLGLDDAGAGWSPIKAGATEAYQLRFAASDDVS